MREDYQYLIESYESNEQANICFRQCVSTKVSLLAKYLLTSVQCFIQLFHSLRQERSNNVNNIPSRFKTSYSSRKYYLIIRLLLLGKPTFIDTVVYLVVYPFISLIDLGLQVSWIQVQSWVLCLQNAANARGKPCLGLTNPH